MFVVCVVYVVFLILIVFVWGCMNLVWVVVCLVTWFGYIGLFV